MVDNASCHLSCYT